MMGFTFSTLAEFNDYFKDEETCYRFLEVERWNNQPVCPHCGSAKTPYNVKARGKFTAIPSYRCADRHCDLPFSVRTGTIFEGSKVELRKWFQAIYEITTSKKGISSVELSTRIGVSQKTAWLMCHKIRQMLAVTQPNLLKGTIQADESYVGGKNKNRHADKKVENSQGRSSKDKTPVVGLIEEGGKVITFVTENTEAEVLQTIIAKKVKKGSNVVTDAYRGYLGIERNYNHIVVKHKEGGYTTLQEDHKFHTQNIENFWSQIKRGYVGIYHYMSPKHLSRYCDEFAVRYNLREVSNAERFMYVIKHSDSKKITYEQLVSS